MKKNIYFASDVHLGFPNLQDSRERELRFARWLDFINKDVEELYLLGDIFDYWFEYKKVVPRGFTRIIGRIAQLTDRGIPVHYFTGNHDLWVSNYLPEEAGVILHRGVYTTQLHGKSFYMTHGDGHEKGIGGDQFLKRIFTNRFLRWLYAGLHPNLTIRLAHAWSNKSRYSKGIVAEEFDEEKEVLLNYAKKLEKEKHFDFYVFGHRHYPLDIPIDNTGSRFINLGDWLTNFTYAVFDGNVFEIKIFQ